MTLRFVIAVFLFTTLVMVTAVVMKIEKDAENQPVEGPYRKAVVGRCVCK